MEGCNVFSERSRWKDKAHDASFRLEGILKLEVQTLLEEGFTLPESVFLIGEALGMARLEITLTKQVEADEKGRLGNDN